jgi:hypothetical protein
MSFDDWNLSSDEEGGFDDWTGRELQEESSLLQTNDDDDGDNDSDTDDEDPSEKKGLMTVAFFSEEPAHEQNDDEEEEIDWEDGHDGEQMDEAGNSVGNEKLAADKVHQMQLKPVTLDWNESSSQKKKKTNKRKRVARRSYRFEHLPWDLQRFLTNLQKSHLLCLTGHAIRASGYCSEEDILHLSHSLIPLAWMSDKHEKKQAPTVEDLGHFCHFFFSLVRRPPTNGRYAKRSSKMSPHKNDGHTDNINAETIQYRTQEYCSHLAATMGEHQRQSQSKNSNFNCYDKVHLLLSMARYVHSSNSFRKKYVMHENIRAHVGSIRCT